MATKSENWLDSSKQILSQIGINNIGGKYAEQVGDLIVEQAVKVGENQSEAVGAFALMIYAIFAEYVHITIGKDELIEGKIKELKDQGVLDWTFKVGKGYDVTVRLEENTFSPFHLCISDYDKPETATCAIYEGTKPVHNLVVKSEYFRKLLLNPVDSFDAQIGPNHIFHPLYDISFDERFKRT